MIGSTIERRYSMKTHLRILSSKNGRVRSAIVRHLLLAAMLSGMLMMLCCAASANDEPVLSPWAKEEATAPVKLPAWHCPLPGSRAHVRNPILQGWYPNIDSAATGVTVS